MGQRCGERGGARAGGSSAAREAGQRPGRRARPGFGLRDLVTLVAVLGLLGCLAALGLSKSRRAAMLGVCMDRQREMLVGSDEFAMANQGQFMGFTWRAGNSPSQWPDLQFASTDSQANADQAVDMLRRFGRLDIPRIVNWIASALMTGLTLHDQMGYDLSDEFNACPEDFYRLQWRRDPQGFDSGQFLPFQPSPTSLNKRWPYTSSYLATAGAMDRSQTEFDPQAASRRIYQGSTHAVFTSGTRMSASLISSVRYPGEKVFFFDAADRHVAAEATYYAMPGAVTLAAFFDGSVRLAPESQANETWWPHIPTLSGGYTIRYFPNGWDALGGVPTTPSITPVDVTDPFRYTRNGLHGWDFAVRADRAPRF